MSYTRPIRQERIWNQWDEAALLVGIRRIPGESNLNLKTRIIGHGRYDATEQGLINYISDATLTDEYNVKVKSAYASLRVPLSQDMYQTIDTTTAYVPPQIISGAFTWTIVPSEDEEKDISNEADNKTWTLWKQPDGSYDQIWTVSIPMEDDIELRYQWNDNGTLYTIQEKPKMNTWIRGVVSEEYPGDTNLWA